MLILKKNNLVTEENKKRTQILEIVLDQKDVSKLIKDSGADLTAFINGCAIRELLDEIFSTTKTVYERDIDELTENGFVKQIIKHYLTISKRNYIEDLYSEDYFTDDIVDQYKKEISQYPLLTDEEVIELCKERDKGNEKAYEKLIKHNLRLVLKCIRRFKDKGLSDADLLQEGNIGLMKAARNFDCTRGIKFSSFAHSCIEYEIIRALTDTGKTVRVPVSAYEEYVKVVRFKKLYVEENGFEPPIEEISASLNLSQEKILTVLTMCGPLLSLDAEMYGDEGDETSLSYLLKDSSIEDFAQDIIMAELSTALEKALSNPVFTDRERQVIIKRFGLFGEPKISLESLAALYKLSAERIRQDEARALRKLRKPEIAKSLATFLGD